MKKWFYSQKLNFPLMEFMAKWMLIFIFSGNIPSF